MNVIRRRLASFDAQQLDMTGCRQAAVALILRESPRGPEVLFIERAQRTGDPWSGHMAFPGGRLDSSDEDTRATAERETGEEIGLSLEHADHLGHIGDLMGNPQVQASLVISAHAYEVEPSGRPLLLERAEVADAFWFPVADLHDPSRHVQFETPAVRRGPFPGIEVGVPERHVVWGLTYRFLDIFFEALGKPLPDRWGELRDTER